MKRSNKFVLGFLLLKMNIKTILLFELVYKLVGSALFTPLLLGLFNLSLKLTHLTYLSNDNIPKYLLCPSTIGILLAILAFYILYTLLEITSIIHCFHASYHKRKITVTQMLGAGVKSLLKIFTGNNGLIFLFVLFLIPLTNLPLVSGYVSSISIPSFVEDYLSQNRWILVLLLMLLVILFAMSVRWIYSIHTFVLEQGNYNQARKKSLAMNRQQFGKNIGGILLWNVLILVSLVVTAIILVAGIATVIKIFSTNRIALSLALGVAAGALVLILIVFSNFMIPIYFSYISAMYYNYKYLHGEDTPVYKEAYQKHAVTGKIIGGLIIAAACINLLYLSIASGDDFSLHVQFLGKPVITAHRGDSMTAPENTIPAFECAIQNHADYAELDVQQTKDGVIVVMHDSNLKRTTGINKNIWEITYDELKDIDAGSWFSKKYDGVRIPTLDEVLHYCKGEIKLNIELKPTGHEQQFEQSVIDIIYDNGYEEDCVIASMKYDCIRQVKLLAPELKTVYVTAVAYGDFESLYDADIISIEASFATSKLVNRLHEHNKLVYAWTVNDEDTVQIMMDVGVDSIITDNTVMVREIINSKSLNENIVEFITELFNIK